MKDEVKKLIEELREGGDGAIRRITQHYDGVDLTNRSLRISLDEQKKACQRLPNSITEAIDRAISHVKAFCLHDRASHCPTPSSFSPAEGVRIDHHYQALESVGLYVPRGKGSFPSMTYMQAAVAQTAGVPRIVMTSPPEKDGSLNALCLYAALRCGVHEIYRIGGVAAIAALAFGSESILPVNKITGPGNPYVSIAKNLLSSYVDTGPTTGPTEALIIADESADPHIVANHMLIEAEHGPDSHVILAGIGDKFFPELFKELEKLISVSPQPHKKFVSTVLSQPHAFIALANKKEGLTLSSLFAPEHLQLQVRDPEEWIAEIKNAGEILVGPYMPFSIANYSLGINSILPTSGFARSQSALSVRDYTRRMAIVRADHRGFENLRGMTATLATAEKFPHHAAACMPLKEREQTT